MDFFHCYYARLSHWRSDVFTAECNLHCPACCEEEKSHLNSKTFSRFSRLSRLKGNALFSLTSEALASGRSSLSLLYWSFLSNVFILSSIAINLCFIFCCSINKMAMQETRKTTTAAYRTHRRISEKRSFNLCSVLSWSMRCRCNFDREEIWLLRSSIHSILQLHWASDMKGIFKMTST